MSVELTTTIVGDPAVVTETGAISALAGRGRKVPADSVERLVCDQCDWELPGTLERWNAPFNAVGYFRGDYCLAMGPEAQEHRQVEWAFLVDHACPFDWDGEEEDLSYGGFSSVQPQEDDMEWEGTHVRVVQLKPGLNGCVDCGATQSQRSGRWTDFDCNPNDGTDYTIELESGLQSLASTYPDRFAKCSGRTADERKDWFANAKEYIASR